MNVEKLIEVVRDYDELYDVSHPKYCDVFHKERLWNLIGSELNQTGTACRTRWNNIRDNYRKCLRKRARESGQAVTKITKYRFEDELSFLLPYYQNLDTTVTSNELQTAEDNHQDAENEPYLEEKSMDNDLLYENEPLAVTHRKRPLLLSGGESVSTKKKPSETAVSTLVKYLIDKNNTEESNARSINIHPVDAFLAGLAPTLKALPPYYLNIAKTKMFTAVQELELACIMEQKANPTGNGVATTSTDRPLPGDATSSVELSIANQSTPQIKKESLQNSETKK